VSVEEPKFNVAPLKFTMPAPLNSPLTANVPAWKFKVPLAPGDQLPAQVLPQLPPPNKVIVPLLTVTDPVLLNGTFSVLLPVPPVFSNVPALLNTGVPPSELTILSFPRFQIPVVAMLFTVLLSRKKSVTALVKAAVALLFSVRSCRTGDPPVKLIPALALVIPPTPFINPLVQFRAPFRPIVPLPPKVPLVRVVDPLTELAPLRVSVPPANVRVPVMAAAPEIVSGPPVTLRLVPLVRLAMVWFAATDIAPIVIVENAPMHVVSAVAGNRARSQFAAVVH